MRIGIGCETEAAPAPEPSVMRTRTRRVPGVGKVAVKVLEDDMGVSNVPSPSRSHS
jgi:hypothetical protein